LTRCIVISGHLGGLGQALAHCFDAAGYAVIGIDRSLGSDVAHQQFSLDLSKLENAAYQQTLAGDLKDAIGGRPVHALINNAAVQHLGPLDSAPIEHYVESFRVNALAPLILSRLLLLQLESSKSTIINMGSIHADLTKPGFSPYSISKAALAGVSRAMALEFGHRIRIVEVRPAAIATPMLEAGFADDPAARLALDECHPTGRIGEPDEIARTILLLAQADAVFLNGAVVNIDGGISHRLHDPV